MTTGVNSVTHETPGTPVPPAEAAAAASEEARTRAPGALGTAAEGSRGTAAPDAPGAAAPGAYELLRDRLLAQAAELSSRTEELNRRRIEEFGAARLELTGTERLRTGRASVPQDVVAIGRALLVGYDTGPAGRGETTVGDVFALHGPDLARLPEDAVPGLLDDPAFVREFAALYRYYREATLLRLRRVEGRLLAVFRTGEKAEDIRVLRWALTEDGGVSFLDARGDRDHVLPPAHDVTWTPATREDHVLGRHPHVSVGGEVFLATVGGALTVKTENDTETAEGIHSEPVDEPLQALADADIAHARVGALILLRVRPYKEDTDRYLVFNTLTRTVVRLDGIGQACRRLPDDQGIVFPGGHCLATGAHRTYRIDTEGLRFEREVRSPNGEDVLYAFRAPAGGRTLLLSYHTIRKEVAAPLSCRGWALSEDGTLTLLRAGGEPPGCTPCSAGPRPTCPTPTRPPAPPPSPARGGHRARPHRQRRPRTGHRRLSVRGPGRHRDHAHRRGLRRTGRRLRPHRRRPPLARRPGGRRPRAAAGPAAGDRRAGARRVRHRAHPDPAGRRRPRRGRGAADRRRAGCAARPRAGPLTGRPD